jgi:hypothetical protein
VPRPISQGEPVQRGQQFCKIKASAMHERMSWTT